MTNSDGHVLWYNQRWYDYTGTNFEQMQGWGWQAVHDPKVLPRVLELWKRSLATGTPFEMEFPLRGVDGRTGRPPGRAQPGRQGARTRDPLTGSEEGLMLRSILIGLDGSRDGESAVELALSWAKAHDALAVGVSIVDETGILVAEQAMVGAGAQEGRFQARENVDGAGRELHVRRRHQHADSGPMEQFEMRREKVAELADFGIVDVARAAGESAEGFLGIEELPGAEAADGADRDMAAGTHGQVEPVEAQLLDALCRLADREFLQVLREHHERHGVTSLGTRPHSR